MAEVTHIETPDNPVAKLPNNLGLGDLWTVAQIKADQDGIRKSLVKIDASIHANAVQCLRHGEEHGDTSLFRRLLVDIIDAKSGYRRQGLIVWMRKFSPMELVGDVIKLSGVDADGNRKPWLIEEANKTPFTGLGEARETTGRPMFRETLMSKVNGALRDWKNAKANTVIVDGQAQAIDKSKPFFAGLHMDKMDKFFEDLDTGVASIEKFGDDSKLVSDARQTVAKGEAVLKAQAEQAA
jgi:hypothetical protein